MMRAHIYYSGMVQGVGFRFTVQRQATALDLAGWVKNLRDGRVEILVEGQQEKIEQFCRQIEEYYQGHVRNKEITFLPAEGLFEDFDIAY
jgi:acylphosphatase